MVGWSVKYYNGKFEEDTLTFDGTSTSNEGSKYIKEQVHYIVILSQYI